MSGETFFSLIIIAGFGTCTFLLTRAWLRMRDRFFRSLALTTCLLGGAQMLVLSGAREEWAYLLQMAAFVLLIVDILRKKLAT